MSEETAAPARESAVTVYTRVGCPACENGKQCTQATDCKAGACTNNLCAAPTCTDAAKNGGESDVDCGGPVCLKRAFVIKTVSDGDGFDTGVAGSNDILGRITDVDCLGGLCRRPFQTE